jgi:DNA-binding CsgD family transcriptional regulator
MRERSGRLRELSPRELEVLRLVEQGLTGRQVARRLRISVSTARSHTSAVRAKLRVSSGVSLVRWLIQQEARARLPAADERDD